MKTCPVCRGTGIDPLTSEPCGICRSYGVVLRVGQSCMACNGHGRQWNRTCNACRGSGFNLGEVVPFQEPPLRIGVNLLKQAVRALRFGFDIRKDEDGEYQFFGEDGEEIHPGALGAVAGLLVWSSERTEAGAEPGRLLRDILDLPDDAELIIAPSGIWIRHQQRGTVLVTFPS